MIKLKRYMLDKLLSLIMALVLMASLLPVTALAASYNDTETHWASSAIEKWSSLGVLQGYDRKFRPDDPITRGEMAVIVDRIMDYQTASKNDFNDLGQAFYTDAVLKANAAGVILGYDGMVHPTDSITREDAIVMLGRALGIKESTVALSFEDAASVSSYAKDYVTALAEKGYINGYNGALNPKNAITRAEIVTILNNAISGLFNEAKEYTGTYAGVVVVNKSGATLKDTMINGDLIIAEGIGNGDVTLDNVKVTGNTIVHGGGENSIHIKGGSYTSLIIEKTDDGKVRVVTSDGAAVNAVYVDDGNDDVILSGSFGTVTMDADVNLVIDSDSNVAILTISVSNITVTNNGSIGTLNVNADGIVIGGNKPSAVNVGSGVKTPPVDGNGNPLKGSSASTGGLGGEGGGGGGNQDQAAPGASLFTATAQSAQGASDGSIAISNITGLQFSADGTTYTNVTASPITGLAAGNYYFRYAAKTGYNASTATTVTVPAGLAAQARVGSTSYATFADAIAAAQTNEGADTITLLTSITLDAEASINANDTLVISNGVTLTDENSSLIGETGATLMVQTGGSFVLVPWGEYGVFSAGPYVYTADYGQWSSPQVRIEDTYFANLDAAIAAANANTTQDDIYVSGNPAYVNGNITFGAAESGSDILTVPSGGEIYIRGYLTQAGGTLTNNGVISGASFTASSGTINGSGIFDVSALSVSGASQTWHSGATVVIDGSTVTGVTGFSASADGSYLYDGISWISAQANVVHSDGTTYYASFGDALDDAAAGDTVGLLSDYAVGSGNELVIPDLVTLMTNNDVLTIKNGGRLTISGELYLTAGMGLVVETGGAIGGSGTITVSADTLDLTGASQDFSVGAVINASNSGAYVNGLEGRPGTLSGIFIYNGTAWVDVEASVINNDTFAQTFYATLAEALAAAHGNGDSDTITMRGSPTLTANVQVDASDTLYLGYSLPVDAGAALDVYGTLDFTYGSLFTVNGTLAFEEGSKCSNLHNSIRITVGASGSVTGLTDSNGFAFTAGSTYVYNGSGWVKQ